MHIMRKIRPRSMQMEDLKILEAYIKENNYKEIQWFIFKYPGQLEGIVCAYKGVDRLNKIQTLLNVLSPNDLNRLIGDMHLISFFYTLKKSFSQMDFLQIVTSKPIQALIKDKETLRSILFVITPDYWLFFIKLLNPEIIKFINKDGDTFISFLKTLADGEKLIALFGHELRALITNKQQLVVILSMFKDPNNIAQFLHSLGVQHVINLIQDSDGLKEVLFELTKEYQNLQSLGYQNLQYQVVKGLKLLSLEPSKQLINLIKDSLPLIVTNNKQFIGLIGALPQEMQIFLINALGPHLKQLIDNNEEHLFLDLLKTLNLEPRKFQCLLHPLSELQSDLAVAIKANHYLEAGELFQQIVSLYRYSFKELNTVLSQLVILPLEIQQEILSHAPTLNDKTSMLFYTQSPWSRELINLIPEQNINTILNAKNHKGKTLLHLACEEMDSDMVRFLISKKVGAQILSGTDNVSPLFVVLCKSSWISWVNIKKSLEIIQLLIQAGSTLSDNEVKLIWSSGTEIPFEVLEQLPASTRAHLLTRPANSSAENPLKSSLLNSLMNDPEQKKFNTTYSDKMAHQKIWDEVILPTLNKTNLSPKQLKKDTPNRHEQGIINYFHRDLAKAQIMFFQEKECSQGLNKFKDKLNEAINKAKDELAESHSWLHTITQFIVSFFTLGFYSLKSDFEKNINNLEKITKNITLDQRDESGILNSLPIAQINEQSYAVVQSNLKNVTDDLHVNVTPVPSLIIEAPSIKEPEDELKPISCDPIEQANRPK